MGKARNRKALKVLGLVSLSLLFFSCSFRKEINQPYTLMWGKFASIDRYGHKNSGKWEAIFINNKLKKIYLYSSLGFPICWLEVKDGGVKVGSKKNAKIPKYYKRFISVAFKEIPKLKDKNQVQMKIEDATIEKKDNLINVSSSLGKLKIRIDGLRLVNP